MATRQYIGARYVPKFYQNSVDGSATWEANVVYEPLTYVTLPNSHMYLSRKQVPATVGTPASNIDYWLDVGSYNGFIEALENEISDVRNNELYFNVCYPPKESELSALDNSGVTDNSAKLQAIVDWCSTHKYKTIFFPEGTYRLDSQIEVTSNYITFMGANQGATVIRGDSANMTMFYCHGSNLQHIDFYNLMLSAKDNTLGVTGISYESVNELRIDNCKFASLAFSIYINSCSTPIISRCRFYMNSNVGQNVTMIRVFGTSASTLISQCRFTLSNITGTAYGIDDSTGADAIVSECTFGGGEVGVQFRNPNNVSVVADIKIVGNEFDRQVGSCILLSNIKNTTNHLNDDSCIISGNYMYVNNDHNDNNKGAVMLANCEGVIVEANTIFNPQNKKNNGIVANSSSNITIVNNHLHNIDRAILILAATVLQVLGNSINSPAYAGTAGITIAGCHYFMVNDNVVKGTYTSAISVTATSDNGMIRQNIFEGTVVNNSASTTADENISVA